MNASSAIDVETAGSLTGAFLERVRRTPRSVAYRQFDARNNRWRDYDWQSAHDSVERWRAALSGSGMQSGDRIAIALPNSLDWVALDTAALSLGLVVVPLYLHDSPANMAFILAHSRCRLLVIRSIGTWRAMLPHWAERAHLEHVWIAEEFEAQGDDLIRPGLRTLADVLQRAAGSPPWATADPDSLATIIYTSGTTGRPKGVMLTQRALLLNAAAVAHLIPPRDDDVFLSCLPLAHAFERTVGYYVPMLGGCTVAYARAIEALAEDFRTLRPTVFLGVPRLYERVRIAIDAQARRNVMKRVLLDLTVRLGWQHFELEQGRKRTMGRSALICWRLLDRLIGMRVRSAFGGRLRVAVSGGAPLPTEVLRFLIGIGLPLVEGYGLTEAGPVVAANSIEDNLPGSVGHPLVGVETAITERGELIVRSPSLMTGYWGEEGLTGEAIDRQGWLHTGDIAEVVDRRLYIRGRLKELLVLSTGEKVLPNEIEARILRDRLFDQALVVGNGRPFPAAILVLEKERWIKLAGELGIDPRDPSQAAAKTAALRLLSRELQDMPGHAQIRAVHLTLDAWTVANGLLTPTLKARRAPLEQRYAREIAGLYSHARSVTAGH